MHKGSPLKDDGQLVAQLMAREPLALREFYDRYAPGLLRRLLRMLGDSQLAKDALQQVFVEALESLPRYRGEGVLGAWLNRIATHIAMDAFRKQGRVRAFWERWSPQTHEDTLPPVEIPEEMFQKQELKKMLWRLLGQLAPKKRMSLLLCDMEGLSLLEAAEQMGIPPGTVSSRLHHARRELREMLEKECKRSGLSLSDLMRS